MSTPRLSACASSSIRYVFPTPAAKPMYSFSRPRLVRWTSSRKSSGRGRGLLMARGALGIGSRRCDRTVGSSAEIEQQHVHPGLAREGRASAPRCCFDHGADAFRRHAARRATRGTCQSAPAGERCGSSPLPDAVTSSAGIGPGAVGVCLAQARDICRDPVAQLLRRRAEVRSRRRAAIVAVICRPPTAAAGSRRASENSVRSARSRSRARCRR